MTLDPIRPYFLLIKVLLVFGLLSGCFVKGCSYGKDQQKKADAAVIEKKNLALKRASDAMFAAGKALRAVNAEAEKRIKQDEDSRAAAEDAGSVAAKYEKKLVENENKFKRDIKKARENPDCDALLNVDIGAKCGL